MMPKKTRKKRKEKRTKKIKKTKKKAVVKRRVEKEFPNGFSIEGVDYGDEYNLWVKKNGKYLKRFNGHGKVRGAPPITHVHEFRSDVVRVLEDVDHREMKEMVENDPKGAIEFAETYGQLLTSEDLKKKERRKQRKRKREGNRSSRGQSKKNKDKTRGQRHK